MDVAVKALDCPNVWENALFLKKKLMTLLYCSDGRQKRIANSLFFCVTKLRLSVEFR